MWIFIQQTGRTELVLNPDHIVRLLGEGGVEVDDPRPMASNEAPTEANLASPQGENTPSEWPEEEQHEQASKITDISHRRRKRRASQ